MPPVYASLPFWTLVAGFVVYVIKFFSPTFPLSDADILSGILFVLGLFGVVPTVRLAMSARGMTASFTLGDLFNNLQFWSLLVGVASFVIHYYAPTFPFTEALILSAVLYALGFFGITPQLRERGFLK